MASHPLTLDGAAILARFLAEHERRAEVRTHIGEAGRCPDCGEKCGVNSKCRKCRIKDYIERGAPCHDIAPGARLGCATYGAALIKERGSAD